jgi:hypothetical protein
MSESTKHTVEIDGIVYQIDTNPDNARYKGRFWWVTFEGERYRLRQRRPEELAGGAPVAMDGEVQAWVREQLRHGHTLQVDGRRLHCVARPGDVTKGQPAVEWWCSVDNGLLEPTNMDATVVKDDDLAAHAPEWLRERDRR